MRKNERERWYEVWQTKDGLATEDELEGVARTVKNSCARQG
jgi:hypothetical protein